MSCKFNINSKSDKYLKQMTKDLQIKIENSKFASYYSSYIYPFDITDNDEAYIPFAYSKTAPGGTVPRPDKKSFPTTNIKFSGKLRPEQKEVKKEAIERLNKYWSVIIAAATGFGKTCVSIYIASKCKLETMIISHRIVLINQWVKAIKKFSPESTVQVLTPQCEKKKCDFYIMNAVNIPKRDRKDYKNIGLLIVDEIHLIMSGILSKCMCYITPRFLLGLSATPYREDGLNILLDLYFGQYKIVRELFRKHIVYKVNTGFSPTVEMARNGKINWNVLLNSQANSESRNEIIIKIVKQFSKKVFLILCKRVDQAKYLVKRLEKENEDVTSLIGKQQEYELSSRILVGTSSKTGTGFDHPRLNALLLAGDIQAYFVQYLGRVFRRQDVVPVVFDLVDKNYILKKHWKVRQNTYLKHGGQIKIYNL